MALSACVANDSGECIDDSMYTVGWKEVSTCKACSDVGCLCAGSGSCTYAAFNHYMYREEGESTTGDADELNFPLHVSNEMDGEVCVEEVRCRGHTVGAAYDYYMREVLPEPLSQTMISVFSGEYKSTCFDISCFVLETRNDVVCSTDLRLAQGTEDYTDILARGYEASGSLLQAICMLDIDPIVSCLGDHSLVVIDEHGQEQSLNVCTSGFKWSQRCGFSFLHMREADQRHAVVGARADEIRAVRTALATVSVVLTPKSMYGGKNPTTKSVSYFVHNVRAH